MPVRKSANASAVLNAVADNAAAVSGPFSGSPKATFVPPYLNYRIASDKAAIDKILAALALDVMKRRKAWQIANATQSATQSIGGALTSAANAVANQGGNATVSGTTGAGSSQQTSLKTGLLNKAAGATPTAKLQAADVLSTYPVSVTTNWYCPFQVGATLVPDLSGGSYIVWSQTWWLVSGTDTYYLGNNITNEVNGTVDGPTYFLNASQNGSKQFFIRTNISTSKGNVEIVSNIVPLNFSAGAACIGFQSATLLGESVPCNVKGGDHDRRPKIEVVLNGPAGPSGQEVFLTYDDPHTKKVVTWFVNGFNIPAFADRGQLDGFLGTRSVMSEKTISITASVNGQISQPLQIQVQY